MATRPCIACLGKIKVPACNAIYAPILHRFLFLIYSWHCTTASHLNFYANYRKYRKLYPVVPFGWQRIVASTCCSCARVRIEIHQMRQQQQQVILCCIGEGAHCEVLARNWLCLAIIYAHMTCRFYISYLKSFYFYVFPKFFTFIWQIRLQLINTWNALNNICFWVHQYMLLKNICVSVGLYLYVEHVWVTVVANAPAGATRCVSSQQITHKIY